MLQTYSEKLNSIYLIPASTLLGGVPMLQTYRRKLTLIYHQSGINTFGGSTNVANSQRETHFGLP
jgi:hypothetical protein